MRKLGLVGGISWVSTIEYYKYINTGVNDRLGGFNYASCVLESLNFQEVHDNNQNGDWEANYQLLARACDNLQAAGAEAILLCANTMHLLADRIQAHCSLPLIHIVTATIAAIRQQGLKKVALLGTRTTLEEDFFTGPLRRDGIEPLLPQGQDREDLIRILDQELHRGILNPQSKQRYLEIIQNLSGQGAEGVILGCTEIPLLVQQADLQIPAFDTTQIHAAAAVDFAIS